MIVLRSVFFVLSLLIFTSHVMDIYLMSACMLFVCSRYLLLSLDACWLSILCICLFVYDAHIFLLSAMREMFVPQRCEGISFLLHLSLYSALQGNFILIKAGPKSDRNIYFNDSFIWRTAFNNIEPTCFDH